MKKLFLFTKTYVLIFSFILASSCASSQETPTNTVMVETQPEQTAPQNIRQPSNFPNLQTEILSNQNTLTTSPIGDIDFKNFTFPFPRGWQDVDSKEYTLANGKRPISSERVGMAYVTTKYGDATGDGVDEAFVIVKIETGGGGVPQIVYVYHLKDEKPELIWHFRSGDRADGGLKNISAENKEIIVELYGQDRYVLGEVETMRIDGDEEQLCCPTHFTRSHYKWNGSNFTVQGKRETISIKDEAAPGVENMGENKPKRKDREK
jgi:hypothetical protein